MARIIGGIGVSHTPTIGYARDRDLRNDPPWRPIFQDFDVVRDWLVSRHADVLLLIYNDHVTSFFFDHYSPFTLGVGDLYQVADEGAGARALPPVPGHAGLARHITRYLSSQEFDVAVFQHKALDHGCFSPLSMLTLDEGRWTTAIVPLQVGVLQFPIPTALRCYKLGRALRAAIESYPEDLNVVIAATGGLSHQIHGERVGFNNTEWDLEFLELLEKDPDRLTALTHAEFARRGGLESVEVIMWLVMRGALPEHVTRIHRGYYLPSMTAIATLILEGRQAAPSEADMMAARAAVAKETQGLESIEGTYPFSLESSARAYRLNEFLHALILPEVRKSFVADPEASFRQADLSEIEKDFVRNRDWLGMIRYGVTFFVLEKLGAVLGIPNPQIYASMKGMSLEDFLRTRRTNIVYSVAATNK
jgi:gallate dioxygenase